MSSRKRRKFTSEQKAEAVRLGSISQVAKDLDLTDSALRLWVKQADIDEGQGAKDALTTEEKEELRKLRRENRTLRMERDFLKKAAVDSSHRCNTLLDLRIPKQTVLSWHNLVDPDSLTLANKKYGSDGREGSL